MGIKVELFRNVLGIPIVPALFFLLTTVFPSKSAPSSRERQERPKLLSGSSSSSYNFPFLCSVHAELDIQGTRNSSLGSCSILNPYNVLFAVEFFDRFLSYYGRLPVDYGEDGLYVVAGAVVLESDLRDVSVQSRNVRTVVIGMRPKSKKYHTYPTVMNPTKPMNDSKYERNELRELANDVGIILLKRPFQMTITVVQIPLKRNHNSVLLRTAIQAFLKIPHVFDQDCYVAGWGPLSNNRIMYHRVRQIPFDVCRDAICRQVPEACLKYPDETIHLCFKSYSYGDVCPYDQGAPLFCPQFDGQVFAVLVKAFDCGLMSLPAVYTRIDFAVEFFEFVFGDRLQSNTYEVLYADSILRVLNPPIYNN